MASIIRRTESLGNVLIVGGSGFLGSHCIRHVLENGGPDVKVFTFSRHIPNKPKQIPNVTYLTADLGDASAVSRAVNEAKPKVVIHVASPRPFIEPAHVYERVNVQGIKNLLSACDKVSTVKALVYCSSVSIIDNGSIQKLHGDESWRVLYHPEQKVPYWHSKAVGEALMLAHNAENHQGMLTTALRVTSIFGEDDSTIMGPMIAGAKTGNFKVQLGNGKNLNCWTYVGTVAEAHTHAVKCLLREYDLASPPPDDKRVGGEAFYITNDEARPFWEFARQVCAEVGYPVKKEEITVLPAFMAWVIGYVSEWVVFVTSLGRKKATTSRATLRYAVCEQVFSMEKAKRVMGFVPSVGIDEAIRRSVAWYKEDQATKAS